MEYNRLLELIEKYRTDNCTKEELNELIDFYETVDIAEGALLISNDTTDEKEFTEQNYRDLLRKIRYKYLKKAIPKIAFILTVIVVLCYSLNIVLYRSPDNKINSTVRDIGPGHSGAVLITSDGKSVLLDEKDSNEILRQGSAKLTNKDGTLAYNVKDTITQVVYYNTLSTPNACQYKLILPDGSRVWLNAASSIRYPTAFSGNERVVELTGEAYFEVVHNEKQSFKIKIGANIIEDIGTSFNVENYTDEPAVKTTLVEGSVKVGNIVLHAGQQADIDKVTGKLTVEDIDAQNAIAWMKGQLMIDDMSIYELLRNIARWYDVKVEVKPVLPNIHFEGEIDRNVNLSVIMKLMEEYGINMQLMNRTLIVSSKK